MKLALVINYDNSLTKHALMLTRDIQRQNVLGTGITVASSLATFRAWLMVDQLHIPEEQLSL